MGAKAGDWDSYWIEFPKRGRSAGHGSAPARQHVVHIGFRPAKPARNSWNMVIGKVSGHFRRDNGRKNFDGIRVRLFDH